MSHRRLTGLFALTFILSLLILPTSAAAHQLCYGDKTPHCLNDPFSDYWERNGGLPVFGYPITSAAPEVNADTGKTYTTQWVERNRLEVHPENVGTPYALLLGLLGKDRLKQLGRDATGAPRESGQKAGCLWFAQTSHNVCNQQDNLGFKRFWESNGLKIEGLDSYARSLQLFGLPLSEPKMETNANGDRVLTQWFERARFEWHPNNPDAFKVLLGLLGKEVRGTTPPPPSASVVVVSHSSSTSGIGLTKIVGEVSNKSRSNQKLVKVTASLYDKANTLIGSDFAYTSLDILKPGQRSPFGISLKSKLPTLDHYTLQIQAQETQEQPLDAFTILSKGDRVGTISDVREIYGELRNDTGVGVKLVKVVSTLYNAAGTVVQVDVGSIRLDRLAPGQQSGFVIIVFEWNGATRYEIQVQAQKQ